MWKWNHIKKICTFWPVSTFITCWANSVIDKIVFFLFFPENRIDISCNGDNLHEISNPVFFFFFFFFLFFVFEKKYFKCLLNFLSRVLSVKRPSALRGMDTFQERQLCQIAVHPFWKGVYSKIEKSAPLGIPLNNSIMFSVITHIFQPDAFKKIKLIRKKLVADVILTVIAS